MNRRLLGPALAVAAAASLAATALPASQASLPAEVSGTQLTASLPAWAHGTPDASEPGDAPVSFVVQLATRDTAALRAFDAQVSDPTSPLFRHFLSPAQFRTRYAPTTTSLATATAWLKSAGLDIDSVSPNRTLINVHGSAADVAKAFDTSFAQFRVDGRLQRAPLSAPVLPQALTSVVANVAGLAESAPLTPDSAQPGAIQGAQNARDVQSHVSDTPDASPGKVFLNARPCSAYFGQKTATDQPKYENIRLPYAPCGYTPTQLRHAYGLDKTGLVGKGATVGIVDAYASPTIESDADTYAKLHGDRPFATGQFTQVYAVPGLDQVPEDPTGLLLDPQGWAGEETLDVEAVHGMAPGADIVYYGAATPVGPALYSELMNAVEGGKVQIVSNSYGTGDDNPDPTEKALFDSITDEAAATGVTIDFSSGDSGDETDPSADGARTADFPATSTGVTAVGGTTLNIDKSGTRLGEVYWGTTKDPELANGTGWDFKNSVFGGAGGGGVSTSYAEPSWQKQIVPANLSTYGGLTTPGRVEPDISMDADSTTGFLTGQTQEQADGTDKYSEYRIGGTSLSCPLFSGLLAQAVGKNNGKGLGLVTPLLYRYAHYPRVTKAVYYDPAAVKVDKGRAQSRVANVRPDYTDPSDPSTKVLYSLRTLGNLATLHAYQGYDDSTGLGSPIGNMLVAKLYGVKVGGHR